MNIKFAAFTVSEKSINTSLFQLAKMSLYLKNESVTDIFFGIFLIVWILTRLIIYPYV